MGNSYYNPYAQPSCRNQQGYCSCDLNTGREDTHTDKCDCLERMTSPMPENAALAMAYVPYQQMGEVYDAMTALRNGTLFPELNKKFTGCCRYE